MMVSRLMEESAIFFRALILILDHASSPGSVCIKLSRGEYFSKQRLCLLVSGEADLEVC